MTPSDQTVDRYWRDKAAIVTGGARGQGAEIALQLLHAGAHVHLIDCIPAGDSHWQHLHSVADGAAGELAVLHADVAEPATWGIVAQAVRERGRGLHALVNNAGITGLRNSVVHTDLDDWQRVIDINLTGSMLGIRALAPLMSRGGSIVNVSSTVGMTGYYSAAYSCSKWALRGLTRSAALELAPLGIRVNCVCPGVIDTEMIRNSAALVTKLQEVIPMQQMAAPQQVADVVLFLLGARSSYITGADIPVDGGVTGCGIYWPVTRALGVLGSGMTEPST